MRLWPWGNRSERKEDIREAQRQAEQARAGARRARELADELNRMSSDELAREIIDGLTGGSG